MGQIHVAIAAQPLSIDAALLFVDHAANGAMCSFVGRVRDHNLGKKVQGVSYDVFAPLAQRIFETIVEEARRKWGEGLSIWLEHFMGRLDVGGLSIVIAVGSPHRDEAFQACRYIIESVKHRSPIWKQEHYVDGDSVWSKGHSLCAHKGAFLSCDNPANG